MQSERAGRPTGPEDLIDVARLVTAYYALHPDPGEPGQRVAFGTSGHRGSSLAAAFNEAWADPAFRAGFEDLLNRFVGRGSAGFSTAFPSSARRATPPLRSRQSGTPSHAAGWLAGFRSSSASASRRRRWRPRSRPWRMA